MLMGLFTLNWGTTAINLFFMMMMMRFLSLDNRRAVKGLLSIGLLAKVAAKPLTAMVRNWYSTTTAPSNELALLCL